MKKKKTKYTVIKDTREQDGWFFDAYDRCDGMEVATMNTGDYTIKGFEDIVCVERKASVVEIANNLGRNKKTFHNEMERMKDFNFRYMLLEFSASDVMNYPYSILTPDERAVYMEYKNYKDEIKANPEMEAILQPVPKPRGSKRMKIVETTKISGKYLMKSLIEIGIWYDVNIVFCDTKKNAFLICNSIFKRLTELFNEGTDDQERRLDF